MLFSVLPSCLAKFVLCVSILTVFDDMKKKISSANGFLAALDQSGGSTPKALAAYGIPENSYTAGEDSMYDMVHEMRTRIMTSPSFTGEKILGAILFENTMDRSIKGLSTSDYLWRRKGIVPFIKVDTGLEKVNANGVQLMKPIPQLDELLKKSITKHMFGTKMRSVIKSGANRQGIQTIVQQQFELGKRILAAGLIPIIEPEVDITATDKEELEDMLRTELLKGLNGLGEGQSVMLKLSLPTRANFYKEIVAHDRCLRVVALSGGYSRDEATKILSIQEGVVASFSRALVEGLSYEQSQADFDRTLAETIDAVYEASRAPWYF